jgi:TonB-dependent SusC/RagA subfamily outer membrane receptor
MIASWMVGLVATAGLLALAARAAEEVLRSYGRATRWVWVAALAGSALLPVLGRAAGDAFPWNWLPRSTSTVDLADLLSGATVAASLDGTSVASSAAARTARFDRALVAGWATASLVLIGLYGATWRRLRRSRRAWSPGRIDGTAVYVSERGGPAVVGVLRPSIVVPEWLLGERDSAQRMVLLHEREHVRAADPLLLAVAPLLAAALPWNLPLWWQLRRLRLAVEVDCDRRVLARGVAPGAYGMLLLDIAGRGGPPLVGAAAIAEPRTFLERRILAMSSTIPRLRHARALALTIMACMLALIACHAAVPTNLNVQEPRNAPTEAAASVEAIERAAGSQTDAPLIIVDSVRVGNGVLRALNPEAIESVEVVKGIAASALYGPEARNGVIMITTKESAGGRTVRIREAEVERADSNVEREPIFLLDGVRVSNDILRAMSPESIDRIEVLKGNAAVALYGPEGQNGVIIIHTKEFDAPGERRDVESGKVRELRERQKLEETATLTRSKQVVELEAVRPRKRVPLTDTVGTTVTGRIVEAGTDTRAKIEREATTRIEAAKITDASILTATGERATIESAAGERATVVLRAKEGAPETATVVRERLAALEMAQVWIDGEQASEEDIARLDPRDIESIEVLKGNAALAAFGVRGVVRITTKR